MTISERYEKFAELNQGVARTLGVSVRDIKVNCEWNALRTYGDCHYINRMKSEIRISKNIINDDEIMNTMLHELCHAYNDHRDGHGYFWKKIAARVGAVYNTNIVRCGSKDLDESATDNAVAEVECPCCHRVTKIYRRGKLYKTQARGYSCSHCGITRGGLIFRKLR